MILQTKYSDAKYHFYGIARTSSTIFLTAYQQHDRMAYEKLSRSTVKQLSYHFTQSKKNKRNRILMI